MSPPPVRMKLMSFMFCDADIKEIINIIEDCRLSSLN